MLLAYANKPARGLQLSYPKQPRKKKGQPREPMPKIASPSIDWQQFVGMSGSLVFLLDIVQYKCSNTLYTCRQPRVNGHASRVIAIGIDKRTKRNSRNNIPASVSSSYKTIQLEQLLPLNILLAVIRAQIQSIEVQNNKLFLVNRNIATQFVLE